MSDVTHLDATRSPDSWMLLDLLESSQGLTALSDTLCDLVDEGVPVVALTGDLRYSNGLFRFAERYPERFVNCGIAEQNMVTVAAGMATCGLMPYAATFASFLALLCCEQIRTDVAYSRLPVRLIGHHAGITLGFYGTSHHATEDLAIMRSIANLAVVAPCDRLALSAALRASASYEDPIYFRIGRGREPDVYDASVLEEFQIGKAIELRRGDEAVVIATGTMVFPALQAVDELRSEGHDIGLLDMHTVKPLDTEALIEAASRSRRIITVEEHTVIGGLGGAVAEVLAENPGDTRLRRHGIKDEFSLIGPPTHLYRHYRLDATGIKEVISEELVKA